VIATILLAAAAVANRLGDLPGGALAQRAGGGGEPLDGRRVQANRAAALANRQV